LNAPVISLAALLALHTPFHFLYEIHDCIVDNSHLGIHYLALLEAFTLPLRIQNKNFPALTLFVIRSPRPVPMRKPKLNFIVASLHHI
jgi:hypothetical protein